MESDLNDLRDYVAQLRIRFDKLRDDVISKLNECNDCIQSAEILLRQSREIRTILPNTSNEDNESKDTKIQLTSTSNKGKVILNVGGEKYTTTIGTLTRKKDTFFTALFSKQWQLECDPDDKSIFIDRDGKLFNHILAYLRTDTVPNDTLNNESLCHLLITEAKYFCLLPLINILTEAEQKHLNEKERKEQLRANKNFPNGTLLQLEHKKKLIGFYGDCNQQWELIYKASRDGFDVYTFHSRCDNKGPTMTIIKSNNSCLFGGYTAISWTSNNSSKNDTTAFLFTLTNPHNIPPTKYMISPGKNGNAVTHNSNYGPTFGEGHDIYLANASNTNDSNYTNFPYSYTDSTGKGYATFTGAYSFMTSDIEVFKLA